MNGQFENQTVINSFLDNLKTQKLGSCRYYIVKRLEALIGQTYKDEMLLEHNKRLDHCNNTSNGKKLFEIKRLGGRN